MHSAQCEMQITQYKIQNIIQKLIENRKKIKIKNKLENEHKKYN